MKIQEKTRKFQDGGVAAPQQQAAAPQDQQQQDPMAQLLQVAAEAVQSQNCEAAMAVCQALVQAGQGNQAPQEEPTFARKGAKLVKVR